jgi:hypothetical protein
MIEGIAGEKNLFVQRQEGIEITEFERKSSMGMALAIIGIDPSKNGENIKDPSLWTNRELKNKIATERMEHQISHPSDTKKHGETTFENMMGALAEFSGDNSLIKSLVFMPSSYASKAIQIKDNFYDLTVVILDRSLNVPIFPLDKDEVAANGWMKLSELQRLQKEDPSSLRSYMMQVIGKDLGKEDMLRGVISSYFSNPERRIPLSTILPSDFSIKDFFRQREQLPDVIGGSGVIFDSKR